MKEISLAQYNADRRHYVFISTENCSERKTEVEELRNNLAGKSLSEGVLLYMSRNHPFDLFKKLLVFIFFMVVIYQRLYTRWFVIACRLQYKSALSVYSQLKIIRWNGYNRWRKKDEFNCCIFITTSLLWTFIVSAIVLKQHLSVSKDRSLKGGGYIRSPYDSGCRHEVATG